LFEVTLLKDRRIELRDLPGRAPLPPVPIPTPEEEFRKLAKKPLDLVTEFGRASGSANGNGEKSGDSR